MADPASLNSDELGTLGESTFEAICVSAKLICNKALRDRGGWDFIVEFPMSHLSDSELDKRQNPASCLFQIKTMWSHNDQIKLRLSSIERLAKDPKPSFIYVMKFDNNLHFDSALLIHLRGEVLEKILRKLRAEKEAGRFAVNNSYMYLTASSAATVIGTQGQDLRRAIEDATGSDPEAYINEKQEELRSLGFSKLSKEMKLTFTATDKEDLVEIFLGEKEAPVSGLQLFETRFGIKLETKAPFVPDTVKFGVMPIDTCTVVARRDRYADPAVFRGSLYMPPKGVTDLAAKIKTDLFDIVYRGTSLRITTKEISADDPMMSPSEWRNYFLFLEAMITEGSTFEIRPKTPRLKPLRLPPAIPAAGVNPQGLAAQLELAGRLSSLMKTSGAVTEPKLSLGALVEQAEHINSAYAILSGDSDLTPLTFSLGRNPFENKKNNFSGLHVNFVQFQDELLVWMVGAEMHRSDEEENSYISDTLTLQEITIMTPDIYGEYLREMSHSGSYDFVMSRALEVNSGDKVQETATVEPPDGSAAGS